MSEYNTVLSTLTAVLHDKSSAKELTEVEMLLVLMERYGADSDPYKAYLLLCGYSVVGGAGDSISAALLQKAHRRLLKYSSKRNWEEALDKYKSEMYDSVRLYYIEESDAGCRLKRNPASIPAPDRAAAYINEIKTQPRKANTRYATKGAYTYKVSRQQGSVAEKTVRLDVSAPAQPRHSVPKPERQPISVSIAELLGSAKEMHSINPEDYCFEVLSKNRILEAVGNTLFPAILLEIRRTINMVGMVGSGKSTLIKALTYHLSKQGKRIVLVVDTADEVLRFSRYFSELGVSAAPLVGRADRMTYLSRVTEKGSFYADDYYSEYLCGSCLVEGMSVEKEHAAIYGDEPCYSLIKGNQKYTCPFFDSCPVTRMQRKALTASVVITTPQGLALTKVGADRRLFLEQVIEQADLVVFDECDRVQSVLDELFVPETEFDTFIHESIEECSRDMAKSSNQRLDDINGSYLMELLHRSTTISDIVQKAVSAETGSWDKMLEHTFSSGTLLERLRKDGIPENVANMLEEAMKKPTLSDHADLFGLACNSLKDFVFDKKLRSVLAEFGYTEYSPEILSRIKLFLIIAGFDSYIREVDEQHSVFATENSDKELYNFLSSRFTRQKKLLPTSIMGNLFGMKYDKEKGLVMYRQFAYGRVLLTSLPWLSMSDDGKPLGPNVLLLSGSSWAEGCLEYHVNVPVRYILESEPWKMEFLSRAEVSELGIPGRVSGSDLRSRRKHLAAVILKSMDTIRAELDRNGCILVIVNSYDEAVFAQTQLNKRLEEYRLPYKTVRMVRDMKEKSDACIPRGMLPDFAEYGAKILIAPAKAIERGYNIVDEAGHSVFGSLFLMVRPLCDPEDISLKCSKLNGMIDAKFSHKNESNELKKAADIRKTAAINWRILETGSYGLSQLPDELRTDVTAGIFVMILQIFGRLARVADPQKEPPRIYFADGSFRASEKNRSGYDCLREIASYLSNLMNDQRQGAVASALYKPFYTAFMRGVENNESKNSDSTDGFYSDDECYC